jgi:putative transport protein
MQEIRILLESQPLFALFLTIALGYLLGEINIKGFSLGSGAVSIALVPLAGIQVEKQTVL